MITNYKILSDVTRNGLQIKINDLLGQVVLGTQFIGAWEPVGDVSSTSGAYQQSMQFRVTLVCGGEKKSGHDQMNIINEAMSKLNALPIEISLDKS